MNTPSSRPSWAPKLDALRVKYQRTILGRAEELQAHCDELRASSSLDACTRIVGSAHAIAGTASTFGLDELADAAKRIEAWARRAQRESAPPGRTELVRLTVFVSELRTIAQRHALASTPPPEPTVQIVGSPVELAQRPTRKARKVTDVRPRIGVLVTDDSDDRCRTMLQPFGFDVRIARLPVELVDLGVAPRAVLCGPEIVAAVRAVLPAVPIVAWLDAEGLAPRLDAVRAGASALLPRGVDAGAVVAAIESVCSDREAEPGRVLIVEDEVLAAEAAALPLLSAGFEVAAVHDPQELLERVSEVRPEMILMDMHLPGCTGLELAAVLRQDSRLVGVPIVFLTVDREPQRHLAALRVGADDFLSKPVGPDQLVSVVRSRIERSRAVRRFMDRDPLTGLLNHPRTIERLEGEVSRAVRHGSPLSIAMLDVDHFKRINDEHGHAAGDRVLKTLASMLMHRLRRTDIVGRCGGEEFAVLMPDTPVEAARRVMDEVRTRFSEVRHATPSGRALTVTFSGGVAELCPGIDAGALWDRADSALYAAKNAGRNRLQNAA